ncbi:CGNR zinc finger domain-containing protein [Nocardiopsis alba]|jgi:hypothetical protein|uniref:CGNR zinc finger domain-containing protein n=1 Tax=Nocardiopsis alba TaxID=53437 RepID=UPI0033A23890
MAYDRPPAPGDLALIEGLCNSARFLKGEDPLASLDSARAWANARDLPGVAEALDVDSLAWLKRAREAVREHLEGDRGAAGYLTGLSSELLGAPRWGAEGEIVLPVTTEEPVRRVVAEVLSVLAVAELADRRARLKVCRSPECRWVFYDRSPAGNGGWCSMEICGARHKMRTYRERRRG